MILNVRSTARYEFLDETFLCLMVEPPMSGARHAVIEEWLFTSPTISCELKSDLYGNPRRLIIAPKGPFTFEFSARVDVSPNVRLPIDAVELAPQDLPDDVMIYTLPSRYCQSDLLTRMADNEFGEIRPGSTRVNAVCDWVRQHVEYRYGTTDTKTSAFDTATERIGVCRDFAHLVIAFCRALGVPARYVSGYALGLEPPDFHGFAQVYLSGEWHNIDATIDSPRPALLPIAVGRDAADVAMVTTWGRHELIEQFVEVAEASRG